jgi:hypothetical protein
MKTRTSSDRSPTRLAVAQPSQSVPGQNGVIDPFISAPAVHAVVWKQGKITDLGVLGNGYESTAFSVNNRGEVAGLASDLVPDSHSFFGVGAQEHAVIWRNGSIQDLGTLGGTDAIALYINELGQVRLTTIAITSRVAVERRAPTSRSLHSSAQSLRRIFCPIQWAALRAPSGIAYEPTARADTPATPIFGTRLCNRNLIRA